jgi:hypothetical protein
MHIYAQRICRERWKDWTSSWRWLVCSKDKLIAYYNEPCHLQFWPLPTNTLLSPVLNLKCRNPSFGLATKAKGLQGCGLRGSPGVTSETPRSVGECERVSLHTPKTIPKLGEGVPMDSRNFRERFEGSNLNGLLRSLYQWKALEA